MPENILWSKYHCVQCEQAKMLLKNNGIKFEERKIGDGYTKEELLEAIPTAKSVPQIFLNGEYVGGLTELKKTLSSIG